MKRLVLDRLWPVLTALVVLIAGALVLQEYARRRGNDTVRIVIQNEQTTASDDDDSGAAGDGDGSDGRQAVSDLHAKARVAARRGLLAEALPLFEKAVAAHPDSPELLGEQGYWLTVADQPRKALPILEKADRLRPSAQSALRLGNVRRELDDPAGAEREYRRALELQPSMNPARVALGNALRRRGELREAIGLLEAATQAGSNEERARALVALGSAMVASGRRPDGEKAFDRAIAYAPARVEIRIGIARSWLATGRKEDAGRALAVLARATELSPDLPAVWYALGRAREKVGDTPGALEAYDRVFRLDPTNKATRKRIIRLAVQTRDFARARHEAEKLLAEAPEDPESQLIAAGVADKDGRKDDARRYYRAAIERSRGGSPEALLGLAQIERAAGDLPAARASIRKAIGQRPGSTSAWLALGRLEEASERPADAEKAYRKAIELDPKFAPGWLALGQLHSDQRQVEGAIADLRQALAARPGYPAAELSLGVALAKAGRTDEAIAAYGALVRREPRYVSAWLDLGIAYRKAGRAAEARDALQRAVDLDSTHVASRRELGDLDLTEGKLAEAKALFEDVLDLAPGDVTARIALAQIAARGGNRSGCLDAARLLRADAPNDPRVVALPDACAAAASTAGR
jgi:tetratricopeptide (TPR) repeat protein